MNATHPSSPSHGSLSFAAPDALGFATTSTSSTPNMTEVTAMPEPVSSSPCDTYGRTIDYLRVSLTDRCNLRCVYCMPEEGVPSLGHNNILTLEEIALVVRIAAERGIKHIRLTGGEPLVRKGITWLIREIKQTPGIKSVALTTNATLLARMAPELKEAGLDRVNISLDSLDPQQYRAITRRGNLSDALAGIEAALAYDFSPVKINVVVVRHLQQDLAAFARLTLDKPLHVRFIEYMPIGNSTDLVCRACPPSPTSSTGQILSTDHGENTGAKDIKTNTGGIPWSYDDIIPVHEIREQLVQALEAQHLETLVDLSKNNQQMPEGWGPATYSMIEGARGTLGFISAMSDHFCATCNRLRLTADGKIRPCLFSDEELDIKHVLRTQSTDALHRAFDEALHIKPESHHHRQGTQRSMSQMGG